MPVTCLQRSLPKRENQIRKILRPLLIPGRQVAAKRAPTIPKSVVFAAFSGSSPVTTSLRDWRFKTVSSRIKGNYFEVWQNIDKNTWSLSKAYLKLVEITEREEKELLSLHCDPNLEKGTTTYLYKSGPHLHVIHPTNHVISKAHIALNMGNLDLVVNSLEKLDEALHNAIVMVSNEVVRRF